MSPNITLLKEARGIIGGIPSELVQLSQWITQEGPSLEQGTVCCPATWLTKHPDFQARGFYDDGRGRPAFGDYRGYAALGALFGIDSDTAKALFRPSDTPAWKKLTDKDVWLGRVDAFLARHGARTSG